MSVNKRVKIKRGDDILVFIFTLVRRSHFESKQRRSKI